MLRSILSSENFADTTIVLLVIVRNNIEPRRGTGTLTLRTMFPNSSMCIP